MTEPTPEERLRRLLSEAVEPVEPAPGAEARLRSTIRAGRRERDLPRRLRWAGATLGVAALVAGGVFVVTHTSRDDGSSASSSATSPTSLEAPTHRPAPQAAAASPSAADSAGGAAAGSSDLSENAPAASAPSVTSLTPGAGTPSLSGRTLTVAIGGTAQTVTLPPVGVGARVLGIRLLNDAAGGQTPVAFIRLAADAGGVRDTAVAVVAGRLTVLQLAGQPAVLTVNASGGYPCATYLVSGADLVPSC